LTRRFMNPHYRSFEVWRDRHAARANFSTTSVWTMCLIRRRARSAKAGLSARQVFGFFMGTNYPPTWETSESTVGRELGKTLGRGQDNYGDDYCCLQNCHTRCDFCVHHVDLCAMRIVLWERQHELGRPALSLLRDVFNASPVGIAMDTLEGSLFSSIPPFARC
jgi:hypothetical protein